MKMLFLCGSPRQRQSCSFTVARLVAQFLDRAIEVSFVDVSDIRLPEDASVFSRSLRSICDRIEQSDAVVWVFGCHVGYVPARMKQLLDHLLQHCEPSRFEGRWTGAICTSGGLRDDAAIEKLRFVTEQLGFAYAAEISAAGNPGLYYDNDSETEASARRFAMVFNMLYRNRTPVPRRKWYVSRSYLRPVKTDMAPEKVFPDLPEKEDDDVPLLIVAGADPETDARADYWIRLVERRYPGPVSVLMLSRFRLEPCRACLWCNQFGHGRCLLKDGLEDVKKEMYRFNRWLILSPVSAASESYSLKVFFDRIWVDIHQAACAGKTAATVLYGGGPTSFMAAEHMRRFMKLLGFCMIDIICDDGRDAVSNTADLDRVFGIMTSRDSNASVSETFNLASDREGIKRIVSRWGYVLRSDYRYFCRNGLLSFREKIPTRRLWWIMGSPKRFAFVVKWSRRFMGEKREKRLKKALEKHNLEKRTIELTHVDVSKD